jgi:hypothetical protein
MFKNEYKILCFSWHAYLLVFFSYVVISLILAASVEQNIFWEFPNCDRQGLCITIRFTDLEREPQITKLVAKCNVKARQLDKNRNKITFFFYDNKDKSQKTQIIGINRRESKHKSIFEETKTISFPATSGDPRFFPFDYIAYDKTMEKPQDLTGNYIRINNQLQGFQTYKLDIKESEKPNQVDIEFKAKRNPLYKAAFIAGVSLSIFFFVVIIFFVDDENKLATSILGYVISVWAIRNIITTNIQVPTGLVDYVFISFIVLIGFGIIEKIVLSKRKAEKQKNK